MDFELSEEQALIASALDRLAAPYEQDVPTPSIWLDGVPVARALEKGGFFEVGRGGGGLLDAVLLVERIARLPQSVEVTASALVAPLLIARGVPGPIALASGAAGKPVRFLDRATHVIVDDGERVSLAPTEALDIAPCESIFGYPFGIARSYAAAGAETIDAPVARFRALWRLGLAAEIAGAAAAALDRTVAYVKERHQFNRPIGSFQAVQHRLAECAVAVRGMRMLALKAGASGAAEDAALAVVFAQRQASRICYDLQQFHGAIGLTVEYPLHYWTHRIKALEGELGGASVNARSAALAMSSFYDPRAAAA